ncbi:hypothetical protein BABINDRAFT_13530 [Babjeviella inositovora NRRL Y-12698]|uniref:BRO domain-containing protein 1 n=1 Tax=Babjeviella inositovora NRRL Y-12698 TaxID=984486 RepID=A0A1E3QQH3_9ASCO|nr:uncharacterized protein BABINDRAFT_13530 [Babjeviella inositovora NRRL Y-12698]ODQ79935.1 hypothetical protein BABINDRAFT_13530 [Babjeviella inositovora NRRL Y-12698]
MKSPLIAVPLKKTEPTDWSHPLKSYLRSHYGGVLDLEANIEQFQRLRTDLQGANADATGRDIYYRYYGQLELLDLRLVSSALPKIEFTWHDAFLPTESARQSTFAFEKANILFNLGAILSKIGHDAMCDGNFKDAYAAYQQAAGVFEYVGESFLHAPSVDLHVDTVKSLAKLMLAQAQEVFILKMVGEGKTVTALFPRLLQCCAALYRAAHEQLTTANATRVVVATNLLQYVYIKAHFYVAAVNYHQALVLETSKPGEAIAYLKAASSALKDHCNEYTLVAEYKPFQETLKDYNELIHTTLARLEKDNDFVYHAVVPAATSLPEIKPMESAKALPLTQHPVFIALNLEMRDLFEKIIPLDVHELNSLYSEEKAQLIRDESEAIDVSNEMLASIFEYLNLPKALHEIKHRQTEDETDPQVLSMAYEISHGANLFDERDKTEYSKKRVYDLLAEAETKLRGVPEGERFRQELTGIKKSLLEATENDAKLSEALKEVEADLRFILKHGRDEEAMKKYYLGGEADVSLLDMEQSSTLEVKISALETHMLDLTNLRKERTKLYDSLKQMTMDDDISQILILNKKALATNVGLQATIFQDALLKYKPYQDRINLNIAKQSQLISALKRVWNEILAEPSIKQYQTASQARTLQAQTAFQRVLLAYQVWQAVALGISQGALYYTQLLGLVKSLGENIDASARRASATAPNVGDLSARLSLLSVNESPRSLLSGGIPSLPSRPDKPFQQGSYQNQYQAPPTQASQYHAPPAQTSQYLAPQLSLYQSPQQYLNQPSQSSQQPLYQTQPYQIQPQQALGHSQPPRDQPQGPGLIYNEPSVFDRSLYTSYSNTSQPQPAQPPQQPPYDGNTYDTSKFHSPY